MVQQDEGSGRISRRTFQAMLGAATVPMVAGCLGDDDDDDEEFTPDDDDLYGGHLRIGMPREFEHLSPVTIAQTQGYVYQRLMYSNLTGVNQELELQPDLATEWEPNDDFTEWTFTLREGVEFAHGKEVLAEDVKATLEMIEDPDIGSAGRGSIGPIDRQDIEAVDDHTVRIGLERPSSDFPRMLTIQWARILPSDIIEDDLDAFTTEDYGSGPFNVVDFEPDTVVELERNDDYYMTDEEGNQLPYLDRVSFHVYPESAARNEALFSEEVDLLFDIPFADFPAIEAQSGSEPSPVQSGSFPVIQMRSDVEPFDDIRVRDAIKHGVDRSAMLSTVVEGYGRIGNDNVISPAHFFHAELDDKYSDEADIETAQNLLEDAGYPDGIELDFPMFVPPESDDEDIAVLFQDQMSDIGIEFDLNNVTWDTFIEDVEGQAELLTVSYGFRFLEDEQFRVGWHEDGPFYSDHWHDGAPDQYQEFADALDDALATDDDEARQDLYATAQELMRDYAGAVIPYYHDIPAAKNDYVGGDVFGPTEARIYMEEAYIIDE